MHASRTILMLGLVAACGGDRATSMPDSTIVDASASGPAAVLVTAAGQPVRDARVVFQHRDSTVIADVRTTETGAAEAVVEPDAFVTVEHPARQLRTFAGVMPGDTLELDTPDRSENQVRFPLVLPRFPEATSYEVFGDCFDYPVALVSAPPPEGEPIMVEGVACSGVHDFVVIARGAAPEQIAIRRDVTVADGAAIDLSSETYVAFGAVTYAFTAVPSRQPTVARVDSKGILVASDVVVDGTLGSVSLPSVPDAIDLLISRDEQAVLHAEPSAMHHTADVSPRLPVPSDHAYDASSHAITWNATSGTVYPTFVLVGLLASTGGVPVVWEMAASYSSQRVEFPHLPSDLALSDPRLAGFATVYASAGYDALRGQSELLDASLTHDSRLMELAKRRALMGTVVVH